MSTENVELVRAFYAAWNAPDRREATLRFVGDDFEWINPDYAVESGTRHGVEGWLAVHDNLAAVFENFEHRPGEFIDLGDRVLCYATFVARGDASDIAFERAEPQLWTIRDGKIARFEWFHDRAEAEAAAGIA